MVEDEHPEIRTFATMAEIRALEGFKENNGVTKENYERLFGDYDFPEEEAKCCFEKSNGVLCGEDHKWGFVALLKDKSLTIVGNVCVRDRFGEDAAIKKDRTRYLNAKRRQERKARLHELIAGKDAALGRLELLKERLAAIETRVQEFLSNLGDDTIRRLHNMARSANASVSVDAVTYKEYIDEEGHKQTERRVSPTRLGSFNGLTVLNDHTFSSVRNDIGDVLRAYARTEVLGDDDVKLSELERITATLGSTDRIADQIEKLERDVAAFLANDPLLLCFLIDDRTERYKAAKFALELSGKTGGKDRAKAWLTEKEQELRKTLNADKISIRI